MGWFWGDLKEEPVEIERTQPKVHTTTDEVLEEWSRKLWKRHQMLSQNQNQRNKEA